ncbi:MAG: molybdate ABC transporter substrate-binding protein [Pseudazoarcus pumilus]|nr:molybdate ABC transporter substrate-binding protein [Pseudazoarcus pumilus]
MFNKCLAALALLFALPVAAADIRVAVAANFHGTVQKLAPLFKVASGHDLVISAGSSGALTTQILNGAPFDVFLSADAARPEKLEQEGHALAGSRFVYALGVPVLWSAREGVVDADAKVLERGEFRHLAIADPRLAPYGKAAEEILRKRGVFATIDGAGKLVRGQSIGQTYSQVASGAADLGFVALAQVRTEQGIAGSYWIPPKGEYTPIAQAAVVLKRADDAAAAQQFLQWLRGAEARAVIEAAGYGFAD